MAAHDVLRAARQHTASLTSPDVCLSRQELAELVNTWAWDHHQKMLEHSANWVHVDRRQFFHASLDLGTLAALGSVA